MTAAALQHRIRVHVDPLVLQVEARARALEERLALHFERLDRGERLRGEVTERSPGFRGALSKAPTPLLLALHEEAEGQLSRYVAQPPNLPRALGFILERLGAMLAHRGEGAELASGYAAWAVEGLLGLPSATGQ